MGKEKEKTQQSVSTNQMWGPAEAHWKSVLNQASNITKAANKKAPQLQPLNWRTKDALNITTDLAYQPIQGLDSAFGFANNMLSNNGMTAGMNEAAGYLTPFANGSMQEDPRLAAMLETNANRAANAAATRFGGGRYGSAAIGNGVGTAVTDANNATMLQSNENARNRQMQASGMLGQLYQAGVGNAMQAGAMLPGLNNLRYDGASRLAGVGDFYQNRAQTNADMKRNFKRDNVAWQAGILGGLGNLGGTTVTTTPKQGPSTAQGILGGAATGGALFGPLGALGGGLLGMFA